MAVIETPYPGIETWVNANGIRIVQLHYTADPHKGTGEKVFVPEINKHLTPWALKEYEGMTDKSRYLQEYEIDFSAVLGQKLFYMEDEATLCDSFPIPDNWTRYYGLDPHPAVPHAHLWCAVDPYGDRWYYREFWPSKLYGKPGNVPDDDNRYPIRQHLEVVKFLESKDNPENQRKAESIYRRVIDYASRSFGLGTSDDPEGQNFEVRFEQTGMELGMDYRFEDAKKDRDVGIDLVNEGLKPRTVELSDGRMAKRSRIRIFRDRCPELLWELHNNRRKKLTATQAETMDPTGQAMQKRNHMTDLLRYIEMARPEHIDITGKAEDTWQPLVRGVNY